MNENSVHKKNQVVVTVPHVASHKLQGKDSSKVLPWDP